MNPSSLSRRHAIAGVAGVGIALPVLAACGSDDGSGESTEPEVETGEPLIAAAEVPVGGGVLVDDAKVVVTQPVEGEFKCFTSICTHQGCPVTKVEGTDIVCDCHGSTFSIEDGSATKGPAEAPLEEFGVAVEGDDVVLSS